jgi:hypothetical protein
MGEFVPSAFLQTLKLQEPGGALAREMEELS